MFNLLKLSSVLLLLTLIGCAPKIEDIAASPPSTGAFEQALFDNYIVLATMERDEYDRKDSAKFASNASMIAAGNSVGPEKIADRELPADRVNILTGARKRLTTAFYNGAKVVVPADAAKAQSSFDCWMQEQEENRQPKDIEACQNDFIAAMERVDAAMAVKEEVVVAEPAPAPEVMAMPDPVTIYFGFDSSALSKLAMVRVEDVVSKFKESGASILNIGGHTDTAGASAYNDALAKSRVEMVRNSLVSKGIPATAISAASFGQKLPAVTTVNNKRDARNRRVEVRFVK